MAKTKVDEWDTVPANNADIDGISILGTAPASNMDNALRELMAQIRATPLRENPTDMLAELIGPARFETVADLIADAVYSYTAGTGLIVVAAGDKVYAAEHSYTVAASGASDHHVTTAGSVKLYVDRVNGEYNVEAFGALGNDSTDNTTTLQAALDAAAGYITLVPPGIFKSQALTPPANTTIVGRGKDVSKIRVMGTNQNLFTFTNKSNLTIRDLGLYGNSSAAATGQGEAIRFFHSTAATADQVGLHVENCHFENFKADAWILCYTENTTYRMKKIRFIDSTIQSSTGNVLDGSTLGVMSNVIAVAGAIAGTSYVDDVVISGNVADGTYIKRFADMWYGSTNCQITDNILKDFGADASITDTGGAYAIMAYDSSFVNSPNGITVARNTIDGVRACGIYMAGARDVHIADNIIRNQTDTSDASMPKGGICMNACWDYVIANNALRDIACTGIRLNSSPVTGVKLDAKQNAVVTGNTIARAKQGIRVHGITAASYPTGNEAQNFLIEGNSFIDFTSIGVEVQTFGADILDLSILGNHIVSDVAGSYGIRGIGFGGTPVIEVDRCVIKGNNIEVPYYGIEWMRANTGSTLMAENVIHGPVVARGIQATYCSNIAFLRNTFDGFTSGAACFYTVGSTGNLSETRFINCGTSYISVGATDMGRAVPTWTPTGRGEFVESLMLGEVGTTPNKYVNRGWYYDGTAWREQRALTGN